MAEDSSNPMAEDCPEVLVDALSVPTSLVQNSSLLEEQPMQSEMRKERGAWGEWTPWSHARLSLVGKIFPHPHTKIPPSNEAREQSEAPTPWSRRCCDTTA